MPVNCRTDCCALEEDIALARNTLDEQNLALVVAKNRHIITISREHGVKALLAIVLQRKEDLAGAVVGDRVVGRASAMLCMYCRAAAVYTPLASEGAVRELESAGIPVVAGKVAPFILNRTGTDICPLEKMTAGLRSGQDVVGALEAFFSTAK